MPPAASITSRSRPSATPDAGGKAKTVDNTADPPVGSASTSSAGRRHVKASATAVVVTPGDPDAEVSTISAMAMSPGMAACHAVAEPLGPTICT